MGDSKGKVVNWPEYNRALKQRGYVTFWVDKKAVESWYNTTSSGQRGRSHKYTDEAIRWIETLYG